MARSSPTKEDLTGQRFGQLVVLGRADQRGSRGKRTVPLWECRCDCGNITYKSTDVLTNPSVSMCSECADKYTTDQMREHLRFFDGTQIGKLTVDIKASNNLSGVRGVYYDKNTNKYRVRIKLKGKLLHIGSYSSLDDAIKAREEAQKVYYGTILESYKNSLNNK